MKLIILDRDGVINKDSAEFIKTPDEWIPIKGSLEAIARLSQAGYDVVIITNQSGIGRGLISADMLGQIHVRMIDYIRQAG
ncbi:MAG: D-glycero-D-manno-heptose 1,7-bisphosphate phosphatase, partial [Arenicella sp.]